MAEYSRRECASEFLADPAKRFAEGTAPVLSFQKPSASPLGALLTQKHRTIARCLCALWGYSNDKRKENGCDGRTRTSSLKDMSLASCHCSTSPERVRASELIGCCTFPALFLIVIIAHLTGKHQHTFAHILTESIAFGRT